MQREFALSQSEKILFVDDDYKHWEYDGTDHCWKGQFFNYFAPHGQQTSFCVAECSDNKMTEPILEMIRSIKGWVNETVCQQRLISIGILQRKIVLHQQSQPYHDE